MAPDNDCEGDDTNDAVLFPITTATETLTPPSSSNPPGGDSLPFELVVEILCRLPVKSLLQLRCVCKSWNSLISDPKFAKKHLRYSPPDFTRHHLIVSYINDLHEFHLKAYLLLSVSDAVPAPVTQLDYPLNLKCSRIYVDVIIGSCNGILCVAINESFVLFCNPSTRRFKEAPCLRNPRLHLGYLVYGFGYDHFADSYKVVAVFCCREDNGFYKTQVKVHTLGTHSWRSIQDFPSCVPVESAIFVSGTLNWLACVNNSLASTRVIVSQDLGNECYQELLQPGDRGRDGGKHVSTLGVLRDCLCILSENYEACDVWLMKEYGNQESWTKLFTIPSLDREFMFPKLLHISEDDEVLLENRESLYLYKCRDNTFKFPQIQYTEGMMVPGVYVESLISP